MTTLEMTTTEDELEQDVPAEEPQEDEAPELEAEEAFEPQADAQYSPDEDKIRLDFSAYGRLDRETWQKLTRDKKTGMRGAGFTWDPIREVLVTPWTPSREDWAIKLAGFVGDSDTTLVERAEERFNRFGGYRQNKLRAATDAHARVAELAEITGDGPIISAHHSYDRASSRARKIENRIHKAVELWETAEYWKVRAAGAIRHAAYKERPDVRHRRIKGLLSDRRKHQKNIDEATRFIAGWTREPLTLEWAKSVANYSHMTVYFTKDKYPMSTYEGASSIWSGLDKGYIDQHQAAAISIPAYQRGIAYNQRWIDHIDHRLAYENAMLGESGGLAADSFELAVGGKVKYRDEWVTILRINRKDGQIVSVSTNRRYVSVIPYENIAGYEAPTEERAAAVKAATKLPPIVNYPAEGFLQMTKAEYDKTVPKWSDFPKIGRVRATETTAAYRIRQTRKPGDQWYSTVGVFLTDVKRVDPPKLAGEAPTVPAPVKRAPKPQPVPITPEPEPERLAQDIEAMRETLRSGGVQVEVVPQLFASPVPLAERVAAEANIQPGDDILEPSVGTCRIMDACFYQNDGGRLVGVEINPALAQLAQKRYPQAEIVTGDFLQQNGNLGRFDCVVMNPPFTHGSDIAHIKHALTLLKPTGRLVAVCLDNDKRREALKALAEESGGFYEQLPAATFKAEGTYVDTALVKICA